MKSPNLYIVRCSRVHQGTRKLRDVVTTSPVVPVPLYNALWRFDSMVFQITQKRVQS